MTDLQYIKEKHIKNEWGITDHNLQKLLLFYIQSLIKGTLVSNLNIHTQQINSNNSNNSNSNQNMAYVWQPQQQQLPSSMYDVGAPGVGIPELPAQNPAYIPGMQIEGFPDNNDNINNNNNSNDNVITQQ